MEALSVTAGFVSQLRALIEGLDVHLHLYTNDPDLTVDLVTGDLDEVAYTGYASVPMLKWSPPALRAGRAFSDVDTIRFEWTTGATPDPVRGYYLTDGPAGALVAVWRRPGDPFELGPDHPLLLVNVRLSYPPVAP